MKRLYERALRFVENPKSYPYKINLSIAELGMFPPIEWTDIRPIFIVSTGRTGTKFLAKYFNSFNTIYAVHEPLPTFLHMGIKYAQSKNSLGDVAGSILRKRSHIYRNVERSGANIYIECNNRLFSLVKPLIKAFNDPKIIHIVRDGRDFVRSGMSRGWYLEGDPLPRISAKMFPDDKYYSTWNELTQFEKIVWLWQKQNKLISQDLKGYKNGITIRFEDIFYTENFSGLKSMMDFLEIQLDQGFSTFAKLQERKINKTKKYSIPHWKDWDESMKDSFDKIAKQFMAYYGY